MDSNIALLPILACSPKLGITSWKGLGTATLCYQGISAFQNLLFWIFRNDLSNSMVSVTTTLVPSFPGERCEVIPKGDLETSSPLGIAPCHAWAKTRIALFAGEQPNGRKLPNRKDL